MFQVLVLHSNQPFSAPAPHRDSPPSRASAAYNAPGFHGRGAGELSPGQELSEVYWRSLHRRNRTSSVTQSRRGIYWATVADSFESRPAVPPEVLIAPARCRYPRSTPEMAHPLTEEPGNVVAAVDLSPGARQWKAATC